MKPEPPILQFDSSQTAVVNPTDWHQPIDGIAPRAVITWMKDVHDMVIDKYDTVERHRLSVESADSIIYELEIDNTPVILAAAQVGAPISTILLETLIAIGCDTFISVGSSGGLTSQHPPSTVVVPTTTIRDEGTSYHYLPANTEASPDTAIQNLLWASLNDEGFTTTRGAVWTTDGLFRETRARVDQRISQGALAVDMEAAALAAAATFRGVQLGQIVYVADTLIEGSWDPEALVNPDTDFRYRLLLSTLRCCCAIPASH